MMLKIIEDSRTINGKEKNTSMRLLIEARINK